MQFSSIPRVLWAWGRCLMQQPGFFSSHSSLPGAQRLSRWCLMWEEFVQPPPAAATQRAHTAKLMHQMLFTSAFQMLLFFSWADFTVSSSGSNSGLFICFSDAELFNIFTLGPSWNIQIGCIGGWVSCYNFIFFFHYLQTFCHHQIPLIMFKW